LELQEYKDWNEIFQFQRFLTTLPEFDSALVTKSEKPDLILDFGGQRIGIEHTLYHSDPQRASGSLLQAFESDTKAIINRAREIFEGSGGIPLVVSIDWNDSHWHRVTNEEKVTLPEKLAKFVSEHVPQNREFTGWQSAMFDWQDLYQTGLENHVAMLDIRYHGPNTEVLWSAGWGGAIPVVSPDRLREIIASKECKYDEYLTRCDQCWLLVYGTSAGMSSSIDFEGSVTALGPLQFETRFKRIFYFDSWSKKTIELSVKTSPVM
jgi:hypothetical protein